MATISHSEVESMLLCERKHFYGYALEIEPKTQSEALIRGIVGHSCLEVFYKCIASGGTYQEAHNETMQYLFSQIATTPGKIIEELKRILTIHFRAKPFMNYKVLAVEKEFVLDLGDDTHYPLVIDLILQDPRRRIAVVDHKFIYDFYQPKVLDVLPQIPKYIGALRILGKQADYGIHHMLRYRKMKENVEENTIRATVMEPTEARIKRTMQEQFRMTERVIERRAMPLEEQTNVAVRTGNKMVCETCSFQPICAAELNGENAELVLKAGYKARERRTFTVEEAS